MTGADINSAVRDVPNSEVKPSKPYSAAATVVLVVVAMSACVLGLVVWKALDSRNATLALAERDTRNLAHSLSEQASTSIQSTDIAMSGVVDLLKYERPPAERLQDIDQALDHRQ